MKQLKAAIISFVILLFLLRDKIHAQIDSLCLGDNGFPHHLTKLAITLTGSSILECLETSMVTVSNLET